MLQALPLHVGHEALFLWQLVRRIRRAEHLHHHVPKAVEMAVRQPSRQELPRDLRGGPPELAWWKVLYDTHHDAVRLEIAAELLRYRGVTAQTANDLAITVGGWHPRAGEQQSEEFG
ncbi:MAG TPA: hypothetical protein VEX38_08590, partial [Fimbriimonadaceae bacterium]|nr:hypothetical protein [Fimbriimonadaceae bacterium]